MELTADFTFSAYLNMLCVGGAMEFGDFGDPALKFKARGPPLISLPFRSDPPLAHTAAPAFDTYSKGFIEPSGRPLIRARFPTRNSKQRINQQKIQAIRDKNV